MLIRNSLAAAVSLAAAIPAQLTLTTQRVATGLSRPIGAASPIGDYDRLFLLEQTGRIKILRNGAVLPTPFLDIATLVNTSSGSSERGMLGFAFHPNYRNNGHVFVHYTRISDGASMVVRYTASTANPDTVNTGSATTILGPVTQPFTNHNGGCLQFGPDGYLYVGLGDGGSGGDPGCRAQNNTQLLGKILRLNVDNLPNIIPPSNPFVGQPGLRGEIFHYGLRNPWRFSFDRVTGDLYIGDVGQNAVEEIDFHAAGQPGGVNYGWKIMEGPNCYSTTACTAPPPCNSPLLTRPIYSYAGTPRTVIGGYVYRGCAIPSLRGTYFLADYLTNTITSFAFNGTTVSAITNRTAELSVTGQTMTAITSFGEDACGEIYICTLGGGVHKIVPRNGAPMTNLGFGELASNNIIPRLAFCGPFAPTTELILENAPGVSVAALVLGSNNNPTQVPDVGLVVPYPPDIITGAIVTDANGRYATPLPTVGSWVVHCQWVLLDPANPQPFVLSNAVRLVMP
ncbi:MAG: PQQ-dependent sugar dehydrogenase [Planctomycetes bacterium]|nr:PQQ-dependent sugar dehydrogenase [Planctomycetota bacterium]